MFETRTSMGKRIWSNEMELVEGIDDSTEIEILKKAEYDDDEFRAVNDHFTSRLIKIGDKVICVKPYSAKSERDIGMEIGDMFVILNLKVVKKLEDPEFFEAESEEEDLVMAMGIKLKCHLILEEDGFEVEKDSGTHTLKFTIDQNDIARKMYIKYFPIDNVTRNGNVILAAFKNEDLHSAYLKCYPFR